MGHGPVSGMAGTKIVRIDYDVEVPYVYVRVPDDLDPDEYDEWFDVINSRAELAHDYVTLREEQVRDVKPDWDLTK